MRTILACLIFTNTLLANPCTDPFFTVEIDGITHSGSTKTAYSVYLQEAKDMVEYADRDPKPKDYNERIDRYQSDLDKMRKFWCHCKEFSKPKKID